jgi:hypothetical protein
VLDEITARHELLFDSVDAARDAHSTIGALADQAPHHVNRVAIDTVSNLCRGVGGGGRRVGGCVRVFVCVDCVF